MGLLFQFIAGESAAIEAAIRNEEFSFSDGPAWTTHAVPLDPTELDRLTGARAPSFWKSGAANLLQDDECGLHRLPPSELDRLIALDRPALQRFAAQWNRRRAEDVARRSGARSMWKSRGFRKILAGFALGGVLSLAVSGWSWVVPAVVGPILAGLVGFVVFADRRAQRRASSRPKEEPVDWVEPLGELQAFLKAARDGGKTVYYYWSL